MRYTPPIGGAPDDPYVDFNPVAGIDGSAVPAAAIEAPQREIMAVIEAAGLVPDPIKLDQLLMALNLRAPFRGLKIYDTAGTYDWIVPLGVFWGWTLVVGGGGGGGGGNTGGTAGTDGGASSFGALVSAEGGPRGGGRSDGYVNQSSTRAQAFGGDINWPGHSGGYAPGGTDTLNTAVPAGGRGVFGFGDGGDGGNGGAGLGQAGASGAGAWKLVPLTPGDIIPIIVGAGGAKGVSNATTFPGRPGGVVIQW